MKKKYLISLICVIFIVFVLLIIIIFAITVPTSHNNSEYLHIIEDASYFDDFYVKDDKVYIMCYITISNSSTSDINFTMCGELKADVIIKLLKEPYVYIYNDNNEQQIFHINHNENKLFEVTFVGDCDGRYKKTNRLLPKITIIEMQNNYLTD